MSLTVEFDFPFGSLSDYELNEVFCCSKSDLLIGSTLNFADYVNNLNKYVRTETFDFKYYTEAEFNQRFFLVKVLNLGCCIL